MRGGLSLRPAPDPLQAAVDASLDLRLDARLGQPVVLGLSGGGDSLALLHLAAAWCAAHGRPLLALTVNHGLSAESAGWTARAGRMAAEAEAAWRALAWNGPKPATGLPAAARAARHALLAEAAREAGASVLLLAHTADDVAETVHMGAGDARSIGRLRAWAPSPAWPEGRGVMLLRPLLEVARAELRAWLRPRGLAWIDDPANLDPRFARARARLAMLGATSPAPDLPEGFGEATPDGRIRLPRARLAEAGAARVLRAAIACASGGSPRVSTAGLEALRSRLATAQEVDATLGGARLLARGGEVQVVRELGRDPPADLPLEPDRPAVWDGRFEVRADAPGWSAGAAAGRLSRLSAGDRQALQGLLPAARAAAPVLLNGGRARLADPAVRLCGLVPARFDSAVGRVPVEPPTDGLGYCPMIWTS